MHCTHTLETSTVLHTKALESLKTIQFSLIIRKKSSFQLTAVTEMEKSVINLQLNWKSCNPLIKQINS